MKIKLVMIIILSTIISIGFFQDDRKNSNHNSVSRSITVQPISSKLNSMKLEQQKRKIEEQKYEYRIDFAFNFPLYCNSPQLTPKQRKSCFETCDSVWLKNINIDDRKKELPYTTTIITDSLLSKEEVIILNTFNTIEQYRLTNKTYNALRNLDGLEIYLDKLKNDTLRVKYNIKSAISRCEIFVQTNEYEEALQLALKTLSFSLKKGNDELIASSLSNLCFVSKFSDKSLNEIYPFDEIYSDFRGDESVLLSLNLGLGDYYFSKEHYELAKEKLLKGHQILLKQTKKRNIARVVKHSKSVQAHGYIFINDFTEEIINTRVQLGFIYLRNQEYEEAEDWFFSALDIYNQEVYAEYYKGENADQLTDKQIGDLLFWLTDLFIGKGEYSKAINYLNQSFYIYENLNLNTFNFYLPSGNILLKSNYKEAALRIFLEKEKYVNRLSPNDKVKFYYGLGNCFLANNNKVRAEKYWLLTDSIATKFNISSYINDANQRLTELYLKDSLYSKSLQCINKAIKTNKEKVQSPIEFSRNIHLIENFNDRAMTYQAMYEKTSDTIFLTKAYEDISISLKILEYNWNQFLSEKDRNNLLSSHKYVYQNAAILLTQIYLKTKNEFYLTKSFDYINFSKSNTFSLKLKETKNKSNIPAGLFTRKQMLEDSLIILEQKFVLAQQKADYYSDYHVDIPTQKVIMRASLHMLIDSINLLYPKYRQQVYEPNNISSKEIQSQLQKSEAFVNYFVMGNIVFSVTISKSKIEYRATVCDVDKLNKYLEITRAKNPNIDDFVDVSSYMFDILFDKSILTYNNIIISPDHFINFTSFDCLITKEVTNSQKTFKSLPYLIKTANIEYTPSPNVWYLLKNTPRNVNNNKCLAFAPVINKYYDDNISSLPESNYETNAIRRRFTGNFYKNNDASISNFINKASDYSVVHIASHGILNDDNPMFSEVILSAGENENKLESFYVHDIYNMQLNNDLTVLSICNSSSGKYVNGEGLMSFTRALQHAGSSNVIGSLWEIDDYSTSRIFETFYKRIRKREQISTALRKAKLDYIDNQKATECIPYYWAAFNFSGRNEALKDLKKIKKEQSFKVKKSFLNNYGIWIIVIVFISFFIYIVNRYHTPEDVTENPYDV